MRGYVYMDVWVMEEYENKKLWTKLYNVSNTRERGLWKALYIYEVDLLLMGLYEFRSNIFKLVVYVFRNSILKISEIQNNIHCWMDREVYIESFI